MRQRSDSRQTAWLHQGQIMPDQSGGLYDGVTALVDGGRAWMSSTWTSAKPLTWFLTTSFSLNCRSVDLKGGLLNGLGIGCLDAAKGL